MKYEKREVLKTSCMFYFSTDKCMQKQNTKFKDKLSVIFDDFLIL